MFEFTSGVRPWVKNVACLTSLILQLQKRDKIIWALNTVNNIFVVLLSLLDGQLFNSIDLKR